MRTKVEEPICKCGHPKSDHHTSWFMGGGELVEECEKYGWNETGGMKFNKKTKEWENHCQYFQERKPKNGNIHKNASEEGRKGSPVRKRRDKSKGKKTTKALHH